MHAADTAGSTAAPNDSEQQRTLTSREREVLQALFEGLSGKEIAHRLGLSPGVASFHKRSLMAKADARNDVQLGIWAERRGFITGGAVGRKS